MTDDLHEIESPKRARRPVSFTVFGVLSLTFGSLAFLCNGCCLGLIARNWLFPLTASDKADLRALDFDNAAYNDYLCEHVPGFSAVYAVSYVLGLCLAIVLMISGIGLLAMRRWARFTCIFYGVLKVLSHVAMFAYALLLVFPANHDYLDQLKPSPPMLMRLTEPLDFLAELLSMIYPVFLLVFALHPATTRHLSTANVAEDRYQAPVNDDEDEYQRRRREPPEKL
jgi:hypothetical protein